jgi:hypothetical protein
VIDDLFGGKSFGKRIKNCCDQNASSSNAGFAAAYLWIANEFRTRNLGSAFLAQITEEGFRLKDQLKMHHLQK